MSFLSKIFSKNAPPEFTDFSSVGVDFHSHLIANIDDGVKTIEEALAVIEILHGLGYRHIVTTPHIMSDNYRNSPQTILPGLDILKKALAQTSFDIRIEAAAEYYVDFEFRTKLANEPLLTFGNKKYVLIEFPMYQPSSIALNVIFELEVAGYSPILAHPERYLYWYDNMKVFEQLKDRSVLFQLNILSFCRFYQPPVQRLAEKLIRNNMIELVSTDVHNASQARLLERAFENDTFNKLLKSNTLQNKSLF